VPFVPDHRLAAGRHCDQGRVGGVRQRLVAPHPAGVAARLLLARVHLADDALVHAARADAGVRRRGAREGPIGVADHLAARAAQRDGAAGHRDRAFVRGTARRLGVDRDRVRVAGTRAVHHELAAERRPERGARRHHHRRLGVHRAQPDLRPAVPGPRSADAAAVNGMATDGLREWLLSDRPQSRRQARLGRAYSAWRRFLLNRLAVVGLVIVVALVLVAIFANQLAPYSPYIGDLRTTRLLPPSGAHWFGTDDQGRDILSRVIFGSPVQLVC